MYSDGAVVTIEPAQAVSDLNSPVQQPAVPRLIANAVRVGTAVAVLFALAISLRRLPIGSSSGHFRYRYIRHFSWELGWPVVTALALVLALLWLSRRVYARFEWLTVLGWLVAAVPLQLLLRWYTYTPLASAVLSERANSFYTPTLRWSASEFVSRYMDILPELTAHARTNMPGKTVLYYLLGAFTHNPTALGVLIIVVANLGALLVYLLVRDWLDDRRTALYALILYLFVPGMIYFFPTLNVVSPVPILLSLWLHVRWVRRGHWVYAALLGPALYLTVFFEPLPMVMGLVFLGVLAVALRQQQITWMGVAKLAAIALATFAAAHLAIRLILGYDILATFAYVLHDAHGYNDGRRPYTIWVTRNLWDFTISAGAVTITMVLAGAWDAVRRGITRPVAMLTLCGLAVLAFLDVIGINRGETVRLWIFLAVFLQIIPAWLCARTTRWWPIALVLCGIILQAAAGTAMVGFVRP